jgi:hypothetical protein
MTHSADNSTPININSIKCGDFTWRVSDCEELVGWQKKLLHYAPLPKSMWSSSTPVKHS